MLLGLQGVRISCLVIASFASALIVRDGLFSSKLKHVYSKHLYSSPTVFSPIHIASLALLGIISGVFGTTFDWFWRGNQVGKLILKIPFIARPVLAGIMGSMSVFVTGESQALSQGFIYIDRLMNIDIIGKILNDIIFTSLHSIQFT